MKRNEETRSKTVTKMEERKIGKKGERQGEKKGSEEPEGGKKLKHNVQ